MKKPVLNFVLCSSLVGCALSAVAAEGVWISVPEAPVYDGVVTVKTRAADGTSWFTRSFTNDNEIVSAKWTVSGLGVFEAYVNGVRVGEDFLKPGYTHYAKTKYSFTYDVTDLLKKAKGSTNILAAEVSAGWWRDKIVTRHHNKGFTGRKNGSALGAKHELGYAGAILTEVDDNRLTLLERIRASRHGEITAQCNLRSYRRQKFALKLLVQFRNGI